MHYVATFLCLAVLIGCGTSSKDSVLKGEPKSIPKELSLYQQESVLIVRFEATAQGYSMTGRKGLGVPTMAIVLNREVVITARDGNGKALGTVSVFNPRDVRTTGSKRPARDVLDKGSFTVAFPSPDHIRSIDVFVRGGANAGHKQAFNIDLAKIPSIDDSPFPVRSGLGKTRL